MPTPRTVLVVAGFDSQLKWASRIRDALEARGYTTRAVAPALWSAISEDQAAAAGFDGGMDLLEWDDLVTTAHASDIVICSLTGPYVRRLTMDLRRLDGPGPVMVAGWVGIIIEKLVAGYLDRSLADVVAVNSTADLAAFEHAAQLLGISTSNLTLTGLPVISATPAAQQTGPIKNVVFADQPTVPATANGRRYVYERLIGYAEQHPDRRVILKPRHRPGEGTLHRMIYPPENLLSDTTLPSNFSIEYTPIPKLLASCDLLITVSSTACLEALDLGVRVALVMDLGVQEHLGNHVLLDSGLLRTFDQIADDDIGSPEPSWLAQYARRSDESPAEQIARRADELVVNGERPGAVVAESAYAAARVDVEYTLRPVFGERPTHLQRRRTEHGYIGGTLVHWTHLWLPPIIGRPMRIGLRRLTGRSYG
jgi:hypothetical protein